MGLVFIFLWARNRTLKSGLYLGQGLDWYSNDPRLHLNIRLRGFCPKLHRHWCIVVHRSRKAQKEKHLLFNFQNGLSVWKLSVNFEPNASFLAPMWKHNTLQDIKRLHRSSNISINCWHRFQTKFQLVFGNERLFFFFRDLRGNQINSIVHLLIQKRLLMSGNWFARGAMV